MDVMVETEVLGSRVVVKNAGDDDGPEGVHPQAGRCRR